MAADIGWFNELPTGAVARELFTCNAAPRFVRDVVAGRPYPSSAALADAAEQVAAGLAWPEVELALAGHPRIGERAAGDSAEAAASRREQSAVTAAGDGVRDELAAGNRAYEQRFGHVFLIRAAGRAPTEILAELRRRLAHEPAAERAETTAQLAQITRLRVERLVSG